MKVVLASRNKNKIFEMGTLLRQCSSIPIEILSLDDIGVTDDIEETGTTYEENAILKASVPAKLGYIGIADDSGLSVDALDGGPGVYSARYAGKNGEHAPTYADNYNLLLKNMKNVPDSERGAGYVSAVACVLPKDCKVEIPAELRTETADGLTAFTVRGECRGVITHEVQGEGGFGYDPVFFIPELNQTFAEISAEAKNAISHRGKAVRAFCETFSAIFSEEV